MKSTKSGGIYIEISGDVKKLRESLKNAETMAVNAAQGISNSLTGALSPTQIKRNANQITSAMQQMKVSAKALKADLSEYDVLFRRMGREIGLSGKELQKYVQIQQQALKTSLIKEHEGAVNKLNRALGETSNRARAVKVDFGSIASGLAGLAAGWLSFQSIQEIIAVSGKFDMLERSFYAITGSAEGADQEMNFLISTAQRLGQGIDGLTEGYRGFIAASQVSTLSSQQVKDIFTAVAETSTVLGLSSDRTRFALLALEQMMSKGVVSMEELRRQLGDQIPGAMAIAARSMGVPIQQFMKMVENGEVLADDLLPKLAEELKKTYGSGLNEALNAPLRNIERFKNEVTLGLSSVGEAGLLDAVGEMSVRARTLVSVFSSLGAGTVEVFSPLLKNLDAVAVSLGVVGIASVATSAKIIGATGSLKSLAGSLVNVRALMNPYVALAGLVAGGAYLVATHQSHAAEMSEKYAKEIEELNKQLKINIGLNEEGASSTGAFSSVTRQQVAEEIKKDMEKTASSLYLGAKAIRDGTSSMSGNNALNQLSKDFEANNISLSEFLEKTDDLRGKIDSNLIASVQRAAVQIEAMRNNMENLTSAMEKAAGVAGSISFAGLSLDGSLQTFLAAAAETSGAKTEESLKKWQEAAALGKKRLEAGGLTPEESLKIATGLKYINAELDSLKKKGTGGTSGAKKAANEYQSALKKLNDEVARRTMTEKEYRQYQHEQEIADYRAAGISEADIKRVKESFSGEEIKKGFTEASKALQDFEKEYQSTMGNAAGLTQSITSEMDKYREAVEAANLSERQRQETLVRIAELEKRRQLEASREWGAGVELAILEYKEETENMAKQAFEVVTNLMKGTEDLIVDSLMDLKLDLESLRDFAKGIASDILRMFVRQSIVSPISKYIGAALGLVANAKGGVYPSTSLNEHINSVIDKPTIFAFAKGGALGLMGEAGAEAIMPLVRTSTGDLGVRAEGSGGMRDIAVHQSFHNEININSSSQDGGEIAQTVLDRLSTQVSRGLKELILRTLLEESRPGGILNKGIK